MYIDNGPGKQIEKDVANTSLSEQRRVQVLEARVGKTRYMF